MPFWCSGFVCWLFFFPFLSFFFFFTRLDNLNFLSLFVTYSRLVSTASCLSCTDNCRSECSTPGGLSWERDRGEGSPSSICWSYFYLYLCKFRPNSHTQNRYLQKLLWTTKRINILWLKKRLEKKTHTQEVNGKNFILFVYWDFCWGGFFGVCLFVFPLMDPRFHYFKNYCLVAMENENLRSMQCLFKKKVQTDPFKTLDNFGSVTWHLREHVFTDEWPCSCPQPAGTMLSHPWHVLECAPQLFSIRS